MTEQFYRAFEDQFRGSRATIRERLRVYLPFVSPLLSLYKCADAVDLGCGRGEWLELLTDEGFVARGVDLDSGMLQFCQDLGLDVENCDGVDYLQSLSDESQAIVSAFHVVEHIPFDSLQELISQTLRVLKPGGLMILETPNPENLFVGASSFYLDPTHQRPIPPPLLAFLGDHAGFERTTILRLQESRDLYSNPSPNLLDVLRGASPDYALVAQKAGPVELLLQLSDLFHANYGIAIEELAIRFQHHLDTEITEVKLQAQQALGLAQRAQEEAQLARLELDQYRVHLSLVYSSSSWQLTAPMRRITEKLRDLPSRLIAAIESRPRLRAIASAGACRLGCSERWRKVDSRLSTKTLDVNDQKARQPSDSVGLGLNSRARQIYHDLHRSIDERKELDD